jgi:hypothetical protein
MDLKELLGEELYNQLIEKMGDKHKIALVSDGNWIPKDKFNEINEAKKQLETDIKDRDTQLTDLKKNAGDNEELKKTITQLQTDNKKKDEDYQAKIKDLSINSAIKLTLGNDAHDSDMVAGLVDKSKLMLGEDGKVTGLDEQIKSLRESKAFLFVPAPDPNQQQTQFRGAKPAEGAGGSGGAQPPDFSKMTDTEYYTHLQNQQKK